VGRVDDGGVSERFQLIVYAVIKFGGHTVGFGGAFEVCPARTAGK
jgi:hypothetical protein